MTPGFAKHREEMPYLPYREKDKVYVINSHNFGGGFSPAVNGKMPVAAWIPSRDDAGNGTTTLTDLVGDNDGTLTNMDAATDWVLSDGKYALDFDGSNDYVNFGNVLDSVISGASAKFTLSGWMRIPSSGLYVLLAKNGDSNQGENKRQMICRSNAGKLEFIWFGGLTVNPLLLRIVAATSAHAFNVWVHFAITFDATVADADAKATLYLNGSLAPYTITSSFGNPVNIQPSDARFSAGASIGSAGNTPIQLLAGMLDDIRLFDQVIDSSDIADLYAAGRGGNAS
jgi:hypothetical protein